MNTAFISDIVVVDTDVISFIFKGDSRGNLYQPHIDGKLSLIASQTRAELELWALVHNWGPRRLTALRFYLQDFFLAEADEAICLRWAEAQADARRRGRPISCADSWVAATALAFDVPLVTHNPDDFRYVPGLTVISEK